MAREFPAPHQGFALSDRDTVLLLPCDEIVDGAPLVDDTGGSTFTDVGGVGVGGSLFAAPATTTGSRKFGGGPYQHGALTSAQRAALLSDSVTVEMWLRPGSIGSTQRMLSVSGDVASETTANNALMQVGITAGGEIDVFWERGGGTNVVRTTTGAGVVAGAVYEIGVTRRPPASGTSGMCDLVVQLWRLGDEAPFRQVFVDVPLPTGGTSARWNIGAEHGGGSPFVGELSCIRVSAFAASDAALRDGYARGARDYDLRTVHTSGVFTPAARVLVEDGNGGFVDLTRLEGYNFVEKVSWGRDIDDQVETASVTLLRNVYGFSLAQLMSGSKLNVDAGGVLLRYMRQLKIEWAILPHGSTPSEMDWHLGHHGFQLRPGNAKETNEVESHDLFRVLQNTWVKPNRSTSPPTDFRYGSEAGSPLEVELQKIIDDQEPASGYKGGRPSLRVDASPAWMLHEWWTPPTKNVAAELEERAGQIGWLCQYRWDDHRKAFRLTLYEPDRAKTWKSGDPSFPPGTVLDYRDLDEDGESVRTRCEVEFGDALTTDPTSTISRSSVMEVDEDAEAEFGEHYCRIGLESTTQIRTAADALRLAKAVVADLGTPKIHAVVEVVFSPHIEIGDVVRFHADDVHFDADQDFAVMGYRHEIGPDGAKTTLTLRRGKPAGRVWRWFDLFDCIGHTGGKGLSPPRAPSDITVADLIGGGRVGWRFPTNELNRAYLETLIHVGDSPDYEASPSTLHDIVRGRSGLPLDLDVDHVNWVGLQHRDRMGNLTGLSPRFPVRPRLTHQRIPRFSVSGHAAGLVAGGPLTFAGVDYDPSGLVSSSVVTVRRRGLWQMDAALALHLSSTAGALALEVDRGYGFAPAAGMSSWAAGDSDGSGPQISRTLPLDIGDRVRVAASKPATLVALASPAGDDAASFFRGRLVLDDPYDLPPGRPALEYREDEQGFVPNQLITALTDHGRLGGNASQPNTGLAPIYRAGAIGDRPAMEFDGVDDVLQCGTPALAVARNVRGLTFAAVLRSDSVAAGNISAIEVRGGGGLVRANLGRGGNQWRLGARITDAGGVGLVSVNGGVVETAQFSIVIGVVSFEDDATRLYQDGVLVASGTTGGAGRSPDTSSTEVTIGSGWDGMIARPLIYSRALSLSEVAELTHWYQHRYGL